MSHNSVDLSVRQGRPVELFRFQRGAKYFAYTSADTTQTYMDTPYEVVAIKRSEVRITEDFNKNDMVIDISRTAGMVNDLLQGGATEVTTLTIFRQHQGDGEWITYWRGRVVSWTASGNQLRLKCESVFTSMARMGLRMMYQLQCRHVLYRDGCNLVRENFKREITVETVAGSVISSPDVPNLPWSAVGGFMEFGDERRMITARDGAKLFLNGPILTLKPNSRIFVFAGCDHTIKMCDETFRNVVNFGGFPWIPPKNPFTGDALV